MDPNKVLKRRTSAQQQKRRISANDGLAAKKRPRKGSRAEDGDYDNYIDSVMHQLKNLPPMSTVEPKLSHSFNACSIYGTGEVPKLMSKEINLQKGTLDGKFGATSIPSEGDYYSTMPFGIEPPVPFVPPVSCSQRGFYNQEFLPEKKPEAPRIDGYVSPDLFYSSSPEPDEAALVKKKYFRNKPKDLKEKSTEPTKVEKPEEAKNEKESVEEVKDKETTKEELDIKKEKLDADDAEVEAATTIIKQEKDVSEEPSESTVLAESPIDLNKCHTAWYDLEPEDSDDEPDKVDGPPQLQSRPVSPENLIIKPIPIKPNPSQTITLSDVANLEIKQEQDQGKPSNGLLSLNGSLGVLPKQLKETPEGMTPVTITMNGTSSSKAVLKALKGLAKLLDIDTPKEWLQEDQKSSRAMYRVKREGGKDGPPLDLQAVLNRNSKVCRHCDMVIQHDAVKKRAVDLPFLTKAEVEESSEYIVFCDENCYFHFAIKKTGGKTPEKVTNLKQLEEFQNKKKEEGIAEESPKKEEPKGPKFKGTMYKFYNSTVSPPRRQKIMNEKDLTQMMFTMGITMMPPRGEEDIRLCLFCHMRGDAAADGPARLLNYEVDKWVHLNCALWSEEVYETVSGALVNTETALKSSVNNYCCICEKNYAAIKCFKIRCNNQFHLNCAVKEKSMFYKNKSMFCKDHIPKGEKENELGTLAVYRRVYIERDENRQVANIMSSGMETNVLRLGSVTFLSVGQLLPHQLTAPSFHTEEFIYPIGFKILRYYWSMRHVNKRCSYYCSIQEKDGKPEFSIEVVENGHDNVTFTDVSCRAVWMKVLTEVEAVRLKAKCTKVFPDFINGEDLFGLTEPSIIKILESLPGVESLTDYNFKYGRNPMLELPLAVNPTGCARSEPKLRTHVKRIHNFQRTPGAKKDLDRAAKEMVPFLVGLETIGPYSKNFVQSKASQYRKMKQEWRQNVVLARSKIQGLGLYAARDLERGQMIIEYIGEVIRSNLTDIREKHYEDQNRGIYMFRLDDDRVVDATMTGGVARYINHTCDPNCVTETVDLQDTHIIIFAARRIERGEELSYDYKFDIEDENKIPCLCGAKNCRKWMN